MDILRDSIGWRSYGQFDPLLEYKMSLLTYLWIQLVKSNIMLFIIY